MVLCSVQWHHCTSCIRTTWSLANNIIIIIIVMENENIEIRKWQKNAENVVTVDYCPNCCATLLANRLLRFYVAGFARLYFSEYKCLSNQFEEHAQPRQCEGGRSLSTSAILSKRRAHGLIENPQNYRANGAVHDDKCWKLSLQL